MPIDRHVQTGNGRVQNTFFEKMLDDVSHRLYDWIVREFNEFHVFYGGHMDKQYPIAFEIRGELGMFADPASGSEAISYPLPPASACQGMIESVSRVLSVEVTIVAVALCRKPEWLRYTTNSHVECRVKLDNTLQIHESILVQPCYQILALFRTRRDINEHEKWKGVNHAHSMQHQFYRRLRRGQSYHPASLGRREFLANYVGKQVMPVFEAYDNILPAMVTHILKDSRICRKRKNNIHIERGILRFEDNVSVVLKEGLLGFGDDYYQRQIEFFNQGS